MDAARPRVSISHLIAPAVIVAVV
ncbi:MAG: hypothetical protein H6Q08_2744, partial [Acidobacteria bacterium]|nr:hypothetical protein [Acidobacteriota bacterium]